HRTTDSLFVTNRTATSQLYTLSLHDALPISIAKHIPHSALVIKPDKFLLELPDLDSSAEIVEKWTEVVVYPKLRSMEAKLRDLGDRKSTRLNSSHRTISYAVFCLKKKKNYKN